MVRTSGTQLAEQVREIERSGRFAARSGNLPTWCPGCGYFGIHHGITKAIRALGLAHHEIVTVSGIGCAGRYPFFMNFYGLHTVHGRSLPVATGVKMGNPKLTVFAVGGDGDGLAIGGGHFPHIARRDVNVNYIMFDNSIYGLTKGQPSPSSQPGLKTKVSPKGSVDTPLSGSLLALSYGAGFVARLYAGDPEGISDALVQGVRHNGFSFFHVYSSCLTFDKQFKTWENLKKMVHGLPEGYDCRNRGQAIQHVLEDDYSMGILYRRSDPNG